MVNEFNAGNGNAELNDLDDGLNGCFNAGKRANGRRNSFWQGIQTNGDFCDHAQGAFAAHKQAREVIARTGFFGARAGSNDFARSGDHFKRQDVFSHGAVANGIGATGAGCTHAAKGGIGTRVDRKK